MTWWMDRSCLASSYGCDPCDPTPCGPWVWNCEPPRPPRPVIHFDLPPPVQIPMPLTSPAAVQGEGGACCGSCAKGGGCESECEGNKPSKGHVGALYVSDAELDALGSQVALLDNDVRAAAQKEYDSSDLSKQKAECLKAGFQWDDVGNRCKNLPDWLGGTPAIGQPVTGPITKFSAEEWGPFDAQWNEYRNQTIHEPTRYDILRTQYLSLRSKWVGPMGQVTKAAEPPPLSESSGENSIPWFWIIVGGVVVAIPFMLPAIAGTYLAVTRGRTMGL